MAKKVVASLQKGEGRGFAKVIKMVKSPKTGSYSLKRKLFQMRMLRISLRKTKHFKLY